MKTLRMVEQIRKVIDEQPGPITVYTNDRQLRELSTKVLPGTKFEFVEIVQPEPTVSHPALRLAMVHVLSFRKTEMKLLPIFWAPYERRKYGCAVPLGSGNTWGQKADIDFDALLG